MNASEEIKRTLLIGNIKLLTEQIEAGSPKYLSLLKAREVSIKQLIQQYDESTKEQINQKSS